MHCPVCPGTALVMADRQGIEIDYCPKCRGVWLDRGELDKVIERSTASVAPVGRGYDEPRRPPEHREREPDVEGRRYRDDDRHRGGYRRKRKSLLDDIFDF
jgi:Zn-finger nucleic acid-binding protein